MDHIEPDFDGRNTPISDEELDQFVGLFSNKLTRLKTLYKVHAKPTADDPRGGIRLFEMWPNQLAMYHGRHTRNLILKCRQLGASTFWCLFILDSCLFCGDEPIRCGIISYKKEAANGLLDKCKLAFNEMDPTIKEAFGFKMKSRGNKLMFSNGSRIEAGITVRGDTIDILLVSELGKLAARYPAKAEEVLTGCFAAVPPDGMIITESTAEGNEGALFEMVTEAADIRDDHQRLLGDQDAKLFFFPWHKQAEYRSSDPYELDDKMIRYFRRLELRGIYLDDQQKWWYARQARLLGDKMMREFPSDETEPFKASSDALILSGLLYEAEDQNQIGKLDHDPALPTVTVWHVGRRTACWIVQFLDMERRCYIDYLEADHADFALWRRRLVDLARKKGYRYAAHYFPEKEVDPRGVNLGPADFARRAGFTNLVEIPIANFETNLQYAALKMPSSYFDERGSLLGRQRLLGFQRVYDQGLAGFVDKAKDTVSAAGARSWLLSLFIDPSDLTLPSPTKQAEKAGLMERFRGKG